LVEGGGGGKGVRGSSATRPTPQHKAHHWGHKNKHSRIICNIGSNGQFFANRKSSDIVTPVRRRPSPIAAIVTWPSRWPTVRWFLRGQSSRWILVLVSIFQIRNCNSRNGWPLSLSLAICVLQRFALSAGLPAPSNHNPCAWRQHVPGNAGQKITIQKQSDTTPTHQRWQRKDTRQFSQTII
jgi:hypothetical protein